MPLNQSFRALACEFLVAGCLAFGGCASIVSGENQSISVTTRNEGADVSGAKCVLANDKGTWYVTTPGSVSVHRSGKDMTVNCELAGVPPGLIAVKSSAKGLLYGNILLGGAIGAGVDIATGAAYDYPELITVLMGRKIGVEAAGSSSMPSGSQPAGIPVVRNFVISAHSGSESVVRSHASWDANCGTRAAPSIAWIEKPKNGTVTIRDEMVLAESSWNGSTKCLGKEYMGVRIYYTPIEGFHGQDEIVYRADASSTSSEVHVVVNVQ
jgi:hypothetical protein